MYMCIYIYTRICIISQYLTLYRIILNYILYYTMFLQASFKMDVLLLCIVLALRYLAVIKTL